MLYRRLLLGGGHLAGCKYLEVSLLKRSVPKTLSFAFGLRLRSKTQLSKTRVLRRRLPSGKPRERLRFRDLRGKTLAFKKRIVIIPMQGPSHIKTTRVILIHYGGGKRIRRS